MANKNFDKGSYAPTSGPGSKKGHPLTSGTRGTSIGAARQKAGKPYFPEAPRGFRPGDE